MTELKIVCQKCQKDFTLSQERVDYYKSRAEKNGKPFFFPKYCDDCQLFREQLKSIPKKIQSICNYAVKQYALSNPELGKSLELIFGLARKEMRQNLILFGFLKKEQET